ncbi:hypothetical protein PHET_12385 [Paragonimus heterotremus]|uniref:CCHC-type domain-containing protein n=1 Tax=Paragonimus heterotremus TaxID=100268 RepID=A0A8J4T003_9TREM|nr:hypothetical protein PHET_12385 [Paragonimus heterotremus]
MNMLQLISWSAGYLSDLCLFFLCFRFVGECLISVSVLHTTVCSFRLCYSSDTMDTSHVPNQGSGSFRVGCKKCGFTGHLTFQCRNYLRGDISGGVVLDVSSTTSQSDDDELITTALELKRAALGKLTGFRTHPEHQWLFQIAEHRLRYTKCELSLNPLASVISCVSLDLTLVQFIFIPT